MKWRWFTVLYRNDAQPGASPPVSFEGYGTKDKAVDALENVA